MLKRYEHGGLVWVDLERPTRDEVVKVAAEFSIDADVAEELLIPSAKPRSEFHGGHIFAVMHFPALRHSHTARAQEVDFVVGKSFVITVHYDTIDPLHKFSKVFEVQSLLDTGGFGAHAGYLFLSMLKKLYRSVEHEYEHVQGQLHLIEESIFSGKEVKMVTAISSASRDLLNLRQTIEPHRDMLEEFQEMAPGFFGEDFRPHVKRLASEYYRVHNHIMRGIESVRELRKTNDSLLTTKQNETMRILTVMAVFTFPLTLLIEILNLRAVDNPVADMPHGFLISTGATFLLFVAMLLYFKRKKWL